MTVFLAILIGSGCAGLGYLLRVVEEGWNRAAGTADEAVTLVCKPCTGTPGKCTCISKSGCTHPLCGAADTGVDDITAELNKLLRDKP